MKSALVLTALLSLALSLTVTDREGPEWLDDLDEAFVEAAESDRPILLVFR